MIEPVSIFGPFAKPRYRLEIYIYLYRRVLIRPAAENCLRFREARLPQLVESGVSLAQLPSPAWTSRSGGLIRRTVGSDSQVSLSDFSAWSGEEKDGRKGMVETRRLPSTLYIATVLLYIWAHIVRLDIRQEKPVHIIVFIGYRVSYSVPSCPVVHAKFPMGSAADREHGLSSDSPTPTSRSLPNSTLDATSRAPGLPPVALVETLVRRSTDIPKTRNSRVRGRLFNPWCLYGFSCPLLLLLRVHILFVCGGRASKALRPRRSVGRVRGFKGP